MVMPDVGIVLISTLPPLIIVVLPATKFKPAFAVIASSVFPTGINQSKTNEKGTNSQPMLKGFIRPN